MYVCTYTAPHTSWNTPPASSWPWPTWPWQWPCLVVPGLLAWHCTQNRSRVNSNGKVTTRQVPTLLLYLGWDEVHKVHDTLEVRGHVRVGWAVPGLLGWCCTQMWLQHWKGECLTSPATLIYSGTSFTMRLSWKVCGMLELIKKWLVTSNVTSMQRFHRSRAMCLMKPMMGKHCNEVTIWSDKSFVGVFNHPKRIILLSQWDPWHVKSHIMLESG